MKRLYSLIALVSIVVQSHAQNDRLKEMGKVLPHVVSRETEEPRAAACAPATAVTLLALNNVQALIETGGSLWQDRSIRMSHYHVPKEGNLSVLFAGALWLGGLSPDQQLKLAAIQYRYVGNDYWPGPLTNDGNAEADAEVCSAWDRFHTTRRDDALLQRQYFDCMNDPNCDMAERFPNGYSIPSYFETYPAHGITTLGQDYYLAPFHDYDQDGIYQPENGDYPGYDVLREINCKERRRTDPVPLFGDQTYYWIFNDKGNIHTESTGSPIGMEIRAQAFAFSTNDEVNNMTFYNYVLINQGVQTLGETYFGTWIDCDVGGHTDDYVGCDVQRGLGFAYNGDAFDEATSYSSGYGASPPAVGVDFFEGPYQDEDQIDNPLTADINEAAAMRGIPYKGIGIGYGDGVIDNERFGMRKFLYHGSNGMNGPPEEAIHYYNYLKGYWKNGQRMAYGGNALTPGTGADLNIPADYMFPGDSDPLHFGTQGLDVEPWTEMSSNNPAGDRRFMQSAGPFTLEPGDYNNITVGVVYARSLSGDPVASLDLVRSADDKAQALFDNCFELVSGPDAPDVYVEEMGNQLILYLSNDNHLSSNFHEQYSLIDPTIPEMDAQGNVYSEEQRSYKFQGYMIYQLADATVSISDVNQIEKARLIAQCDVKDDVTRIINFDRDPETNQLIPALMVDGENKGIRHSFVVTEDAFAIGDKRLINHKTYYFVAVAYGYNNYVDFDVALNMGQDHPFIASRKGVIGSVEVVSGIPHFIAPQNGGAYAQSSYGDKLPLEQIEGVGNGLNFLKLSDQTLRAIASNGQESTLQYQREGSPVEVRVVDPLRVPAADFELALAVQNQDLNSDSAYWELRNLTTDESRSSVASIQLPNEELYLSWGLAVTWVQYQNEDPEWTHFTQFIGSELVYDDNTQPWLLGFPDDDSFTAFNWIRSGTREGGVNDDELTLAYDDYREGSLIVDGDPNTTDLKRFTDSKEEYESILGGTWSPYCLVASTRLINSNATIVNGVAPTTDDLDGDRSPLTNRFDANIVGLNNVDIVLTEDKSLWTRCPVLEMQADPLLSQGGVKKMQMRSARSIDKNGLASGTNGCNENEATLGGEQPFGMSWFPGYAVDVSTGERLNLAFGEDSWLAGENGADMIWNPSSTFAAGMNNTPVCGGQHWVYVFKNQKHLINLSNGFPAYDEGRYFYSQRDASGNITTTKWRKMVAACTWVGSAILNPSFQWKSMRDGLIPGGLTMRLRVAKPYAKYSATQPDVDNTTGALNYWNGLYRFSTRGMESVTQSNATLTDALSLINVVPNPYYAFSSYESGKLDNRVKIVNLPKECTITIYDINGTQIRQFVKGDPTTYLDWDLKNFKNIPISGGGYIIHVKVPGAGEKIVKWFGVMRPVDLQNF